MKKYILLLLIICPIILKGQTIDLDKLPESERDSVLLAISKKYILKYAPGYYDLYYDETLPPTISRGVIAKEREDSIYGIFPGRALYVIIYPNSEEYQKKHPYSRCFAQIEIWGNTGTLYSMRFHDQIRSFPDDYNHDADTDYEVFVPKKFGGGKSGMTKSEYERRMARYQEPLPSNAKNLDFFVGTWRYENKQTNETFLLRLRKTSYIVYDTIRDTVIESVVGAYTYTKKRGVDYMSMFFDTSRKPVSMAVYATNHSNDKNAVNPDKLRMKVSHARKEKGVAHTYNNELSIVSKDTPNQIRWRLNEDDKKVLEDSFLALPMDIILTKIADE